MAYPPSWRLCCCPFRGAAASKRRRSFACAPAPLARQLWPPGLLVRRSPAAAPAHGGVGGCARVMCAALRRPALHAGGGGCGCCAGTEPALDSPQRGQRAGVAANRRDFRADGGPRQSTAGLRVCTPAQRVQRADPHGNCEHISRIICRCVCMIVCVFVSIQVSTHTSIRRRMHAFIHPCIDCICPWNEIHTHTQAQRTEHTHRTRACNRARACAHTHKSTHTWILNSGTYECFKQGLQG